MRYDPAMGSIIKRINAAINSLSGWIGVAAFFGVTGSVGVLTFVSRHAPRLGALNWADAVFIAIGTVLLILTILSLGAICYRLIRPLPKTETVSGPSDLEDRLTRLVGSVEIHQSTVRDLETLVSEVGKRVDGLTKPLEDIRHDIKWNADRLDAFSSEVEKSHTYLFEHMRQTFGFIDQAFGAIHDRETLIQYAAELEATASNLRKELPDRDSDPQEWGRWEYNLVSWKGRLKVWCELGERYLPGTVTAVMEIDESSYEDRLWSDLNQDHFPSHGRVHQFKGFDVRERSFNSRKHRVIQNVTSWAFTHPSMKGLEPVNLPSTEGTALLRR